MNHAEKNNLLLKSSKQDEKQDPDPEKVDKE